MLNHNAGVMVGHPALAELVSSRPTMAPPTGLCIEIFCPEKTEGKGSEEVNALFCSHRLSKAKLGNLVKANFKYRVMASGKP